MPSIPEALTVKQFTELYPRYLASERAQKKSEHTVKLYDLGLRKFRDFLADNRDESDEIDPLTVQEWADNIMESVSNNSASQYYGAVDRFFKWAIRMKLISETPIPEGGKPQTIFRKKSIPSKKELEMLLDPENIAVTKTHKPINTKKPLRNYTMVAFMVLTGLRSNELRSLTLEDLDFAQGFVRVRNGKGGKERNAPFPARAQKIVRAYLEAGIRPAWCTDADYLFGTTTNAGHDAENEDEPDAEENGRWNKFNCATLGRIVHRYCMRVIGKQVHPHLLRHCAASIWDDHDVDIRNVQKALGHASLRTTERIYITYLDQNKAANAVNAALNDI